MRIALIGLLLAAGTVSAQDAPPRPGEAEQFVVRFTRALEVDPLGESSSRVRGTLIEWLQNTKDYTVVVCDILGPIPGEKPPHSAELLVQQMFGNVAYQIEHPGEKDRQPAASGRRGKRAEVLCRDPGRRPQGAHTLLGRPARGTQERHARAAHGPDHRQGMRRPEMIGPGIQ